MTDLFMRYGKTVIFDMDDVMYDFNGRVASLTGVPYSKFTQFNTYTNPNFTEEERQRVLKSYKDPFTYRNIRFDEKMIACINDLHGNWPYNVLISSNCASKEIRDIKMEQLLNVVDLPEADIHLNVIDMKTGSFQKDLPRGIYMLVDDSEHNIAQADAKYLVMPARQHNENVLVDGMLKGRKVYRPSWPDDTVDLIYSLLSK